MDWKTLKCDYYWKTMYFLRRRQWHPTPVLLPGKSHGRRSLVGCSPWGREKSDTTERSPFHFSLSCIGEGNGNPLQCSYLENPRDRGAWWAAVYGVAQSRTRLKWLSSSSRSWTWLNNWTELNYSIVWINHNLFSYSSVDGHLTCFTFWQLWIMLLRTPLYKFCVNICFQFSGIYLRVESLGPMHGSYARRVTLGLTFWGNAKLFSTTAVTFLHFHKQYVRLPISPNPCSIF